MAQVRLTLPAEWANIGGALPDFLPRRFCCRGR
jgi:hypothetical protein